MKTANLYRQMPKSFDDFHNVQRKSLTIEVQVSEYRKVIIHDGKAYLHLDVSNVVGYYLPVTVTFLDEHEQEIPQ